MKKLMTMMLGLSLLGGTVVALATPAPQEKATKAPKKPKSTKAPKEKKAKKTEASK